MKLSFTVNIKQELLTSRVKSFAIPALDIEEEVTGPDQNHIKFFGIKSHLQNCILDALLTKEENGEIYEAPRTMDTVLQLVVGKSPSTTKDDTSDTEELLELTIPIDYTPHPKNRRCNCCEKVVPWFVGGVITSKMLLSSLMNVFQMQYAQGDNGLIKMGRSANMGVSIASASITLLWSLWEVFTGGEIIFLKDSGANMDRNLVKLWDRIRCKKNPRQSSQGESDKSSYCNKATVISGVLKTFFILGVLNEIYEMVMGTYTSVTSLSNTVANDVAIPANDYRILQWLGVGLDHLDDPVTYPSLIYFGFKVIDTIINAKFTKKTAETPKVISPSSETEINQLVTARETRAARWSERAEEKTSNRYQLLADEDEPKVKTERSQPFLSFSVSTPKGIV